MGGLAVLCLAGWRWSGRSSKQAEQTAGLGLSLRCGPATLAVRLTWSIDKLGSSYESSNSAHCATVGGGGPREHGCRLQRENGCRRARSPRSWRHSDKQSSNVVQATRRRRRTRLHIVVAADGLGFGLRNRSDVSLDRKRTRAQAALQRLPTSCTLLSGWSVRGASTKGGACTNHGCLRIGRTRVC